MGLAIVIAASTSFSPSHEATYKVVEIRQESKFAGAQGRLVKETLVLEAGGQRYTVRIDGAYHTFHMRRADTVKVGDSIALTGHSNPIDGHVNREDIHRI